MEKRKFAAPDLTDAVREQVGPYTLAMVYRRIPGDEGPTIHVFGPVDGQETEIVRFDCFHNAPHYHLGISYLDEPVQAIDSTDPFDWVLQELAERLPDYLTRSQAGSELPEEWQGAARQATESFRASGIQSG